MIWYVEYINVAPNNSQSTFDIPMMTKEATVTVTNYQFIPFYHENTGIVPPITPEGISKLFAYPTLCFSYFCPRELNDLKAKYADIELIRAYLVNFSIAYTDIIIEWDEYQGAAYYA